MSLLSLARCARPAFASPGLRRLVTPAARTLRAHSSNSGPDGDFTAVHFRVTAQPHPLKKTTWKNPTQNHVWTEEEVRAALSIKPHLEPQTMLDSAIWKLLRGAYHTFNFLTGYRKEDPTARSVELRLLFLESIAGVPGMVAASMRHFKSLRSMRRDHGWIHTLLEEAENERMHLLVFMRMFSPGITIRLLVMAGQAVMVTMLTSMYAVYPKAVHRFVGYLEEMAVDTYTDVIKKIETPNTKLNIAWSELPAPDIAKNYWRLPKDANFLDVLRHVAADETHHRDVNHTFASMDLNEANPYVLKHLNDAASAWREPPAATLQPDVSRVPRGLA